MTHDLDDGVMPPEGGGGRRRSRPGGGRDLAALRHYHLGGCTAFVTLAVLAVSAVLFVFCFIWFGMRIEVGPGQFVVLVQKTGADISNDQILSPDADHKGIQMEILKEGRHFRNPYHWEWTEPALTTDIPQDQVGVKIRKFGTALPAGQILAETEDQKGILPGVLTPGRYYLNSYAFDVLMQPMVKIEPGYMGIVTRQVGAKPADPYALVVAEGETGVQPFLLQPGTHPKYSNPYEFRITPVDVRSQKFEMRDEFAIFFPSKFGFDIKVEGTIEWAPDLDRLPLLFVKFVDDLDLKESGGINNMQRKVILPFTRSFFRNIGGSYRAVDYITGDTRVVVQNEVENRLKVACAEEGIIIKSVVIRASEPPQAIRDQFQRREIARRELERFEKEIEMQIGTPVLVAGQPQRDADGQLVREGGRLTRVIQQRMKDRNELLGVIREEVATMTRKAEGYRNVELTKANQRVAVAEFRLQAAKDMAEGIKSEGFAAAAVKVMEFEAKAAGVAEKVKAFGDGPTYAEFLLIRKFAPGIHAILSDTEGTFAQLFARFAALKAAEKEGDQ